MVVWDWVVRDSEAPWLSYLLWMEFHYSCQGRRRSVPPYAKKGYGYRYPLPRVKATV